LASTHSQQLVQKLWNYCNLLRDDGLSYGDYVEQLTHLLFLKMADVRTKAPYNEPSFIPAGLDWTSLTARDKANLDIFWLRDESLDDAASLEEPDIIAAEIIEDLQTALDEMSLIYADLAPADD
jgi:type I restriction-modification system DNA methylase subunit